MDAPCLTLIPFYLFFTVLLNMTRILDTSLRFLISATSTSCYPWCLCLTLLRMLIFKLLIQKVMFLVKLGNLLFYFL